MRELWKYFKKFYLQLKPQSLQPVSVVYIKKKIYYLMQGFSISRIQFSFLFRRL